MQLPLEVCTPKKSRDLSLLLFNMLFLKYVFVYLHIYYVDTCAYTYVSNLQTLDITHLESALGETVQTPRAL